jgi:hypothetical protein
MCHLPVVAKSWVDVLLLKKTLFFLRLTTAVPDVRCRLVREHFFVFPILLTATIYVVSKLPHGIGRVCLRFFLKVHMITKTRWYRLLQLFRDGVVTINRKWWGALTANYFPSFDECNSAFSLQEVSNLLLH